jgi:phage shock protein A
MENDPPKRITIDQLAAMMANGFAEMRDQFATLETHVGDLGGRVASMETGLNKRIDTLSYKIDQLDQKLEAHRQETKDGFAAVRAVMSGISHTLTDHEERIKELEGE